jgi:hypothetical protein
VNTGNSVQIDENPGDREVGHLSQHETTLRRPLAGRLVSPIADQVALEYALCHSVSDIDIQYLTEVRRIPRQVLVYDRLGNNCELVSDRVVFLDGGRFEFVRNCRDHGWDDDDAAAVIIPCNDRLGDRTDLVAWSPVDDKAALWLGRVSVIGEETIFAPRLGEPLAVHASMVDWLCCHRNGIVILDWQRARHLLYDITLGVQSTAFGKVLRRGLTIPPPPIFVSRRAGQRGRENE